MLFASTAQALTPTPVFSPTVTPTRTVTPLPPLGCPRNVGEFYPYWSSIPYSSIPWSKISHLYHAFIMPNADGTLSLPFSPDPAMTALAHANGVRVLISVGGAGTGSQYWDDAVLSPTARTALVDNLYNFCASYGYDGVDIDWEFPDSAAKTNALNLFVMALRAKFSGSPAPAPGWLITGDLSWGSYYGDRWDVATLKNYMDYFNIMVYDMYGPWTSAAGHNAALFDSSLPGAWTNYNGSASISYYLGRGVPAQQLQYGLAAYGYRFNTEDLYQTCPSSTCSSTYLGYSTIQAYIGAGWTRSFDSSAQSPYLRNDTLAQFITYDDPQSIDAKTREVLWNRGLAGVFLWELSQDDVGGAHPLLDAARNAALCPTSTPTPTRTATGTPTTSPTFTDSPTITETPTTSPTFSITETHTVSPTFSASPSITQTYTVSPTPTVSATLTPVPGGTLEVLRAVPVPHPGPRVVKLELGGPVDELVLSLYSSAYTRVAEQRVHNLLPGWNTVPVQALSLGLAPGLYYLQVQARRGSEWTQKALRTRFYLLR